MQQVTALALRAGTCHSANVAEPRPNARASRTASGVTNSRV
jgi:hypothetical protein